MTTWDVFYEEADGNDDAMFLGKMEGVTQAEALHKAAQFYEKPGHDLIARLPITTIEQAVYQAQLDAPKVRHRRPRVNDLDIWDQALESSIRANIPTQFQSVYMNAFDEEYKKQP